MTPLLLVLAFTLLLAPVVELLWDPLWRRVLAGHDAPAARLRLMAARMAGGLLVATMVAVGLLWKVYHAPPTHPLLPGAFEACLGHTLEHGPGYLTAAFLLASTFGLALLLLALFHPLPCFPPGTPRPDLARQLADRGVQAAVEILPGAEPACWSELTPAPRVLLVGGIEELLPEEELAAVLDHEAGHLALGDHHTRIWARAYRRLLFFCSHARALFDAFVHEQERRADDRVLAWDSTRREPLRKALCSLAMQEFPAAPRAVLSGAHALGALGQAAWSVKQRLARLAGQPEERPPGPPLRPWPLVGLAVLLVAISSESGACTLHCVLDVLP